MSCCSCCWCLCLGDSLLTDTYLLHAWSLVVYRGAQVLHASSGCSHTERQAQTPQIGSWAPPLATFSMQVAHDTDVLCSQAYVIVRFNKHAAIAY